MPKQRKSTARYLANTGINYPLENQPGEEGRSEIGEEVPAYVIGLSPWLLEQGLVTEVTQEDAPAQDGA
jgi:hypothetical protein